MRIFILVLLAVGVVFAIAWPLWKHGEKPSKFIVGFLVFVLTVTGGMEIRWQWLQGEATQVVQTVSVNPEGFAHCQRFSETWMDRQPGAIGWVSLGEKNKAVIKYNQCQDWWNVLTSSKQNLTDRELLAVGVIIHEGHHVGGEFDEAVTQCKTIRDFGKILEQIGTPKTVIPKYVKRYSELSATMHSKYVGGICL